MASLPRGDEGLRRQIALRYLGMGMAQPAEELIVTHGALEALNLCLTAVAQPGDLVAVESPGFYASLQALERLKMKALEIPVHPQDGLDLAALADALQRHPVKACWFMTSFQNPTGASLSLEKKKALVALLAARDIPLIEDDVYAELYFGHRGFLPAKAFDRKGLVMHCSSFSKTLAPGYRVGWVSPGRFGQQIERLQAHDHAVGQPARATGDRRLPAARRLRQAPAQAAARDGVAALQPAGRHCTPFPAGRARVASRGRLFCAGANSPKALMRWPCTRRRWSTASAWRRGRCFQRAAISGTACG